jgi:hypothetical protein
MDLDDSVDAEHLTAFVERAVVNSQQTHHFEQEWFWLQVRLLDVHAAWEQGRAALQHDLACASANQEEMDSLSVIDFASDSYAVAAAQSAYRYDRTLRKWLINGYMVAWREHFLEDVDVSE